MISSPISAKDVHFLTMKPLQKPVDPKKAEEAAVGVEEMFLSDVIQNLFKDTGEEGFLGSGETGNYFLSYLAESIAKSIAQRGIGLKGKILPHLTAQPAVKPRIPVSHLLTLQEAGV